MLARKHQLTRTNRTPPVHERIALQCARNICQLAAALPKPRTRSGHLPVLVELRCPEEDVIYRYQVNLTPSCVEKQMTPEEARALSQQLKLPCLVHGRAQEQDSKSQALLPLPQDNNELPQLVMMQDAVHVVSKRPGHSQHSMKETISTFHYSAYASRAEKITRDHFMAALHEQQASPLEFNELWPDQQVGQYNGGAQEPQLQLGNVHTQTTAPSKQVASDPFMGKTNYSEKIQVASDPFLGKAHYSEKIQVAGDPFLGKANYSEKIQVASDPFLGKTNYSEKLQVASDPFLGKTNHSEKLQVASDPFLGRTNYSEKIQVASDPFMRRTNYSEKIQVASDPFLGKTNYSEKVQVASDQFLGKNNYSEKLQVTSNPFLGMSNYSDKLQVKSNPFLGKTNHSEKLHVTSNPFLGKTNYSEKLQVTSNPFLGKPNYTEKMQLQPIRNKVSDPQKVFPIRQHINRPQQITNSLPKHPRNEKLSLRVFNSYKQPRKSIKTTHQFSNHVDGRMMPRLGGSLNLPQPQPQIMPGPVNGPNAHKPPYQRPTPSANNVSKEQTERFCLPNTHPRQHLLREVHPFYLPRIDNFGNFFDLQRELQLRRKLEQELEQQKYFEQQKYQRIFTESQVNIQVPTELQSLFGWDCCHLCQTAMRTMRNSVDHYLSKTHLRRVDSWLIRYSFVKGHLSDDMLRHLRCSGPAVLHCDLCDLKLTSVIHARQHFHGRRHRLVERHISKPNGEGYYDKTGRWVRTNDKWLMCKLCDIIVTSESQLIIHMAGVRHRKREHANGPSTITETYNGSYVYRINANGSLVPLNPESGFYIYAGYSMQNVRKMHDLNAVFYCEVCNITLNHLKSVKQHEEGRVHRKKLERVLQKKESV